MGLPEPVDIPARADHVVDTMLGTTLANIDGDGTIPSNSPATGALQILTARSCRPS